MIRFSAPKNSLVTAIKNEIFDDMLIGNFMKTQLINIRSLYPDFTPYVAKYADNGMAKNKIELLIKKYGGHRDQLSIVPDGIETYRIQVLEKLIQQKFTFSQKKSMEKMLIRKLKIYANGAQKRGREQVFNQTMKRIDELSAPC